MAAAEVQAKLAGMQAAMSGREACLEAHRAQLEALQHLRGTMIPANQNFVIEVPQVKSFVSEGTI